MNQNQIFYLKIPTVCVGELLEQTDDEKTARLWPVILHSSPLGVVYRLHCMLPFSPGSSNNFKAGMVVLCLVHFVWKTDSEKYINVDQSGSHIILGKYHPGYIYDIKLTNPNVQMEGEFTHFTHDDNQAGMLVGDDGAIHLATTGRVKTEMNPNGDGLFQNMHRTFAQNFFRILSNQEPFNYCGEYFGTYFGKDITDTVSSHNTPDTIYMAYKRFVTQSMEPDIFVSTNEGAWNPWVGANNRLPALTKGSEIIYNKIINYKKNRITIHAGETGSGFYTFRVDDSTLGSPTDEQLSPTGDMVNPIIAQTKLYLGISEAGEVKLEAGVSTGIPAMTLSIKADGTVDLSVGKKFTVNGKALVTEDFIKFMSSHQTDLVQVSAIGAPAPMSPSAAPDFIQGKQPGNFLTDVVANTLVSTALPLRST